MAAAIPAFGDLAKSTKELLWTGSRGEGVFQFDQRASIETKTADGVVFTATTVKKDDTVENAVKAAYKTGRVGVTAAVGASGAVTTTATIADVAPGLNVTVLGTLPDVAGTAKLGLDYVVPHLHAKALIGLNSAPRVDLAATTGVRDGALGASATYDAAKGTVTAWSLGSSLTRPDYQASCLLTDAGKTVKLGYAHNVDAATVAGAEVTRSLESDETVFALGYGKRLASGALAKVRLESTGLTSLLYEQAISPSARLAICSQMDATNLDKAPKVGMNLALRN